MNKVAEVVVAGDLNLDFLKWSNPEQINLNTTSETENRIKTLGYSQLVQGPTTFWVDTEPSLVDQVWTRNPQSVLQCNNITKAVANHNVIDTIIRLKGNNRTQKENKSTWKEMDKTE